MNSVIELTSLFLASILYRHQAMLSLLLLSSGKTCYSDVSYERRLGLLMRLK